MLDGGKELQFGCEVKGLSRIEVPFRCGVDGNGIWVHSLFVTAPTVRIAFPDSSFDSVVVRVGSVLFSPSCWTMLSFCFSESWAVPVQHPQRSVRLPRAREARISAWV